MLAPTPATDPRPAIPPVWADLASGPPTNLAWGDASESSDLAVSSWQGRDSLHARYYNPNIARFLSVDPAGSDPKKPQTWNRYTYVLNNPVNMTDPDGKLWWFVVGAAVAGAMLAPEPANAPPTATTPLLPNSKGGGAIGGAMTTGGAATGFRAAIRALIRQAVSWRPQESFASTDEGKAAAQPKENTNPYAGPVTQDVTVVDSKGNAIPVKKGESLTASPDGRFQQVRDASGTPTGVRMDGPHGSHKQYPHAHRPDVNVPDNDDLPIQ